MTSHLHTDTRRPGVSAPVADWVTIPDLYDDPFPIYERLRAEGGVHWVPAVNRYLITSYEAVNATEHDQEIFSADEEGSLQIRAMGHSMLRRDDPEHYAQRRAWQPVLKPGYVKRVWVSMYREVAEEVLGELIEKGPGADLIWDFAAPYAAETLRRMLGLYNADRSDLQRWSQTLIDATGNYADDPEVWARGERSFTEVDTALDEMLEHHLTHRDDSLISALLSMPGDRMPIEQIRANIKMTIGGGLNEPRDALGVAALAMFRHPDQRAAVMANPDLWPIVFEETIRWVAPIGMYSRQVTRDTVLAGTHLPAGAKLGICVLSANRDETVWNDADRFDIHREVKPHLAFSKGTHVCLGNWAARAQIAEVALPLLFNSLRDLDIDDSGEAKLGGWVFRGPLTLPVTWTAAAGAPDYGPRGGLGSRADEQAGDGIGPRVAVIGAGPAGCFSAKEILRQIPGSSVAVYDRLPVPYGLLRYGVAADHQGTKSVSTQFDRLFSDSRARFIGNTELGTDVTIDALRAGYDAVVLATGLSHDRPLDIPGADLENVHSAGTITRLLNGHPDEHDDSDAKKPRLGRRVALIGHGNVAIDILRLLTCAPAALAGSDIDDAVHSSLANGLRRLDVIGRSGPSAARFDPVMIRELARVPGLTHILHGVDLSEITPGKDARLDALVELASTADQAPEGGIEVHWWFTATPEAITGTSSVSGIDVRHAGRTIHLTADSVITAIGFIRNTRESAKLGLCPISPIPADGKVDDGLFAIGWLRGNGRGTIPDQRADARALAANLAAEVSAGTISTGAEGLEPHAQATDFVGWRRIDHRECLEAGPERCRAKITTWDGLLDVARDDSIDMSEPRTSAGARHDPLLSGVPLTILFGTESGNAELVAEEIGMLFGDRDDVEVADLSSIRPSDLDPGRFHLLVCSTYGDGEVPSSAADFYAALREDTPDLAGVRFAVFGMGDASYTKTYSRGSELLTEALEACGAKREGEYGRHDAGGVIPAAEAACEWAEGVLANLSAELSPA
ncbi:cytochrome P450 [Brevibacterium sanguinis]|uniref:Cytochrome P450 n=2 Tax=Brevibacterium TaxID=1696 RepID=A0A366IF42_9MICO|nr:MULTISPECIES: cytochrome P450 [Brevibacterium]RBP61493.1 cytochrome P450 [Brevibacterium sanguinis]RBP68587.1 cytochrome P450 [Brevibacterium celere]